MALMLSKTYDALLAAGAPEDKARDASEEIASYDNRLTRIEAELDEIRRTMATKTWVLGQTFVLLGGVAALLRLLH